ncbi:MAG: phosphatidylserine decarboxylase [bacterium]|nr:phosphatidylserine decarboxylase [bacterium]
MAKHQEIVEELKTLLKKHEGWTELLESSLKEACHRAEKELIPEEWEHFRHNPAPPREVVVPDTLDNYYRYLDSSVKLIPTEKDYAKEISFQLSKFYWLLDQPGGIELQNIKEKGREKGNEFTDWMVRFAKDWGNFLNTTDSLTKESLLSFYADPAFNLDQYVGYVDADEKHKDKRWPSATWKTFNQFFAREVKPGLRPIAGMFDDNIITSPADCTFREKFKIDDHSEITVKYTHRYNVLDLLADSPYRDKFKDGLFMHSFLGPTDYHRFHAPVRGTVLESHAIQGEVYLGVSITKEKKFKILDKADYQFFQTRGLIVFDSPIGLVAVLPIGMAQVSSVNMTAVEGAYLNKGDEFGYFHMGGSDIILLFQADSGVEVTAAPNIHTNVGMCIAQVID